MSDSPQQRRILIIQVALIAAHCITVMVIVPLSRLS
jgi:hypothetical protein